MPGGRQRAREVVEAVLRRPRLVVGPLVVALLVALAASWLAPRRYRASAHVRAEWTSAGGSRLRRAWRPSSRSGGFGP